MPAVHSAPEPRRAVAVFAACALVFACALLAQAGWQLKWLASVHLHKQPGFWSLLALIGMAMFALLLLVDKRAALSSAADATEQSNTVAARAGGLPGYLGALEYACYFLVYVFAVPRLGYLPATLLGFALLTWRAGYRNRRMLAYSQVAGFAIVLLFKTGLQVNIPGGAVYALLPDALRNLMTVNF